MIDLTPAIGPDRDVAEQLLISAKLPTDILTSGLGELWIARVGDATAVGGFEFYGEDALLRSIAVDEPHRGTGLGSQLTEALLAMAAQRGVRHVWLLTETAELFFARKGFTRMERSAIRNAALLASAEFTHVCASTAVCMMKRFS
jgi:N-acetylglutamate synthase-like GNAT family acetyltransferase